MEQSIIDKINAEVDACIEKYGVFIYNVLADESKTDYFTYYYTIGRTKYNMPEIILPCNLINRVAHIAINEAITILLTNRVGEARYFESKELILADKPDNAGVSSRFKLVRLDDAVAETIVSRYMLGVKIRYPLETVKKCGVYQLLVSDKNNVLPDEPGYDVGLKQPILNVAYRTC